MSSRVVLTRPAGRGDDFADRLRKSGHEVHLVPLTRIDDAAPFPDPALFDGVLFTSVSAVERAPVETEWPRVGAVGFRTAEALRGRGIPVRVVGSGGGAELADAWAARPGERLLLPQAESARPELAEGLRAHGAEVTAVSVYRTVALPASEVDRRALGTADVVCFFAGSAVRAFVGLGLQTRARLWASGPTSRRALEEAGLPVWSGAL